MSSGVYRNREFIQNSYTELVYYFFEKRVDIYTKPVYNIKCTGKLCTIKLIQVVKRVSKVKYPNIEAERARRGLTQNELLALIGYKERKTYNGWMKKGNIPVTALVKMSELFDCTIDYLLGR